MKILIADDNTSISSILNEYAKKAGYETILAKDGEEALQLFYDKSPDLLLLDVMMPIVDGFQVCRKIRSTSMVPIIMITARGEDFERIMGLDLGADDYIVKPFSPSEVFARIRAVMRRFNIESNDSSGDYDSDSVLDLGTLNINMLTYEVRIKNQLVPFTKKEIELLWLFASNPNRAFTREQLLDKVWGYDYFGDSRTIDTHIKRLRTKLERERVSDWNIKTIWGVGYKFEVNSEK